MTEREALSILLAMGYDSARSDGMVVVLSDLLSKLDGEGSEAVVEFWPSHINLWLTPETKDPNTDKRTPWLVIQKTH